MWNQALLPRASLAYVQPTRPFFAEYQELLIDDYVQLRGRVFGRKRPNTDHDTIG